MTDDTLFDVTSPNDLLLSNRVGLAPMTRIDATDEGLTTNEMAHYHRKFADGGFGFLVTEGVYTDDAYSQRYLNQPGLVIDNHVEAWTNITDAAHEVDTPIFAQLMHVGVQSRGNPHFDGDRTLTPSAVQPDGQKAEAYGGSGEFAVPKAADGTDLETTREGFVRVATNAAEAGFDGVGLHDANDYLLNEFLAANANRRDDERGGGPESRMKLPTEVLSAVTDAVPEEFVVGIRVSQEKVADGDYEWPEGEDAAAVFFEELSVAGADYVHTTETDATTPTFDVDGPTFAEATAEYVTNDTVIITNGGFGGPDTARTAVDAGAGLFTLGMSALANPDWPAYVAAGDDLDAFDPAKYLAPTAGLSDHEALSEPPFADD